MTWTRSVLTAALLSLVGGGVFAAQDLPAKNPLEGNPDAIRSGMGLFRGRCADCHGMDAHGVRAGVGVGTNRRWAVQDRQRRHPGHRDARQPAHLRL